MLIDYVLGQTSIVIRVKIKGSADGNGLTALTNASTGLIISTIADNEATPTVYTSAASHIQTIATLGAFAAPSASNCRFQLVDNTNHPGVYEVQIADARYAVSSAKSLLVSISGVSGMLDCDVIIPLRSVNPYDGVHGGMTALPNTACTTNASLLTSGTGTDQLSVTTGRIDIGKALGTAVTLDANNVLNVSAKYWAGTAITATSIPVATAAGAAGGLFIAGTNAATTVAITGNITGNLSGSVGSVANSTAQTGDAFSRLGAPVGASISADVAAVKTDLDAGVKLNQSDVLAAPREVTAVADGSMTIKDALWGAVLGAAGRKDLVSNTVTLATPATHTTYRVSTVDVPSAPTYVH